MTTPKMNRRFFVFVSTWVIFGFLATFGYEKVMSIREAQQQADAGSMAVEYSGHKGFENQDRMGWGQRGPQ